MSASTSPTAIPAYPWYFQPLNWLLVGLASLPLAVLYGVARLLYWLMAYVLRYRRRVVLENLRNSDTSQDWDDAEVESWLLEQGFRETKAGWLADAFTLSRLARDEILSATRV